MSSQGASSSNTPTRKPPGDSKQNEPPPADRENQRETIGRRDTHPEDLPQSPDEPRPQNPIPPEFEEDIDQHQDELNTAFSTPSPSTRKEKSRRPPSTASPKTPGKTSTHFTSGSAFLKQFTEKQNASSNLKQSSTSPGSSKRTPLKIDPEPEINVSASTENTRPLVNDGIGATGGERQTDSTRPPSAPTPSAPTDNSMPSSSSNPSPRKVVGPQMAASAGSSTPRTVVVDETQINPHSRQRKTFGVFDEKLVAVPQIVPLGKKVVFVGFYTVDKVTMEPMPTIVCEKDFYRLIASDSTPLPIKSDFVFRLFPFSQPADGKITAGAYRFVSTDRLKSHLEACERGIFEGFPSNRDDCIYRRQVQEDRREHLMENRRTMTPTRQVSPPEVELNYLMKTEYELIGTIQKDMPAGRYARGVRGTVPRNASSFFRQEEYNRDPCPFPAEAMESLSKESVQQNASTDLPQREDCHDEQLGNKTSHHETEERHLAGGSRLNHPDYGTGGKGVRLEGATALDTSRRRTPEDAQSSRRQEESHRPRDSSNQPSTSDVKFSHASKKERVDESRSRSGNKRDKKTNPRSKSAQSARPVTEEKEKRRQPTVDLVAWKKKFDENAKKYLEFLDKQKPIPKCGKPLKSSTPNTSLPFFGSEGMPSFIAPSDDMPMDTAADKAFEDSGWSMRTLTNEQLEDEMAKGRARRKLFAQSSRGSNKNPETSENKDFVDEKKPSGENSARAIGVNRSAQTGASLLERLPTSTEKKSSFVNNAQRGGKDGRDVGKTVSFAPPGRSESNRRGRETANVRPPGQPISRPQTLRPRAASVGRANLSNLQPFSVIADNRAREDHTRNAWHRKLLQEYYTDEQVIRVDIPWFYRPRTILCSIHRFTSEKRIDSLSDLPDSQRQYYQNVARIFLHFQKSNATSKFLIDVYRHWILFNDLGQQVATQDALYFESLFETHDECYAEKLAAYLSNIYTLFN